MTTPNNQRGILWLKLSPTSKDTLRLTYPPKYTDTYYDHVTLLFDVTHDEVAKQIGKHAVVKVYAHAFDDSIEAVRVESALPDTYGVPHITLSAQSGVEAFRSVAMLGGDHTETPCSEPFSIDGTIEFVPLPTK